MGKHAWKSVGGSVLYNPSTNELVKDETGIEKLLQTFPLNTLGTFLKISDQGLADNLSDIRAKAQAEKAGQPKGVEFNGQFHMVLASESVQHLFSTGQSL
jgi:hypothetical protein